MKTFSKGNVGAAKQRFTWDLERGGMWKSIHASCCLTGSEGCEFSLYKLWVQRGELDEEARQHFTLVLAPEMVKFYNDNKDGVDQYDKYCLRSNYFVEVEMVARKWWHKLYWGQVDGAIVNSYILAWLVRLDLDRYDYMLQLANEMIM
jgi:hypothetical protein